MSRAENQTRPCTYTKVGRRCRVAPGRRETRGAALRSAPLRLRPQAAPLPRCGQCGRSRTGVTSHVGQRWRESQGWPATGPGDEDRASNVSGATTHERDEPWRPPFSFMSLIMASKPVSAPRRYSRQAPGGSVVHGRRHGAPPARGPDDLQKSIPRIWHSHVHCGILSTILEPSPNPFRARTGTSRGGSVRRSERRSARQRRTQCHDRVTRKATAWSLESSEPCHSGRCGGQEGQGRAALGHGSRPNHPLALTRRTR